MPGLDAIAEFLARAALREVGEELVADLIEGGCVPLNSTCLATMCYDPEAESLDLEFVSGHSFSYGGVPPEIALGLLTASSPGGYYNSAIKGKF